MFLYAMQASSRQLLDPARDVSGATEKCLDNVIIYNNIEDFLLDLYCKYDNFYLFPSDQATSITLLVTLSHRLQ